MYIFVGMRFTLGKEEKLKSRKQIERLFLEGQSVKEFPLRLKFLKTDYDLKFPFQVAFSVPKRRRPPEGKGRSPLRYIFNISLEQKGPFFLL